MLFKSHVEKQRKGRYISVLLCFNNSQRPIHTHHALLMKCPLSDMQHVHDGINGFSCVAEILSGLLVSEWRLCMKANMQRQLAPRPCQHPRTTMLARITHTPKARLLIGNNQISHFHSAPDLFHFSRSAAVCPELYSCPVIWAVPRTKTYFWISVKQMGLWGISDIGTAQSGCLTVNGCQMTQMTGF